MPAFDFCSEEEESDFGGIAGAVPGSNRSEFLLLAFFPASDFGGIATGGVAGSLFDDLEELLEVGGPASNTGGASIAS